MGNARQIWDRVFEVGGPTITGGGDASMFIIIADDELVMIDAGIGENWPMVKANIMALDVHERPLTSLVLTHAHIDHIGGAHQVREWTGCQIVAHQADVEAIEGRDKNKVAADLYCADHVPVMVDRVLHGDELLRASGLEMHAIHVPGHTPGSICLYCDIAGKRVLFAQDVHGPLDKAFGSDEVEWKRSLRKLLDIDADILCEGHFGVYRPAAGVRSYIEGYLLD